MFVEIDKKSVKKMFPNLIKELEEGENRVRIDSVGAENTKAEEATNSRKGQLPSKRGNAEVDRFRHYNPNVVDFIRRCETANQAEEIVAYMLKRNEISESFALEIRDQIKREGLRSFGPKKEDDYYCKQGGIL